MNILAKLYELTGDDTWKITNGPDSGCGIDYYFVSAYKNEAYVNNDQGFVTISVDGETLFDGEDS